MRKIVLAGVCACIVAILIFLVPHSAQEKGGVHQEYFQEASAVRAPLPALGGENKENGEVAHIESDVPPTPSRVSREHVSRAQEQEKEIGEYVHTELFLVTKVVDGDTIDVFLDGNTERVRYIGIDTPETVHPRRGIECFGKEASSRNRELVLGKYVALVPDITDRDRYGRLLRYVYTEGVFVNLALVEDGYARASSYPPDVRHEEEFRNAERGAREQSRGLWGDECKDDQLISSSNATRASEPPSPECSIKGNINSRGEKIYHMVGCASYTDTIITEPQGERWFCSEDEATEAGWRKARNC